MPSWIPGSYLLREYARHIVAIRADSVAPIEQVDHSSWQCSADSGSLTVSIDVYALDESVRGNYLDTRRGYFNGPAVFLEPDGHEHEQIELSIERPADPACRDWRVATALEPVDVDESGFGAYRAADYDELIDAPVEIGPFERVEFDAAGVAHSLVVAGRFDSDLGRVASDLEKLCTYQIDFFGRPAPFDRYLFLGLAVGSGYGGLEHRASSSLMFNRDDLPKPGAAGVSKTYRRFLALASHEYFHSWHVKRTKPAAFEPYALDRRNFTRLLWVFEGITSYYQELMVLRSGLIDVPAYLERLGEQLTRVYRTPGRFRQSLSDSSFNAWDRLYKPGPDSPNAEISYYTKGALVALALDLTLRLDSDSSLSLDDAVVEAWRRYGAAGTGVPEGGFEVLCCELGGDGLKGFFERAVRGTEDLQLADLLAEFAVGLELRPSAGRGDTGGTAKGADGPDGPELALGVNHRPADRGLELVNVLDGGAAQRAGLNPGDVLIAVDGLTVDDGNLADRLARYDAGDRFDVTVIRGDELHSMPLEILAASCDTCHLKLVADEDATPASLARRLAWLGA